MRTLYFYHEIEDMYEDMLHGCYAPVSICGYDYDAGRALRLIDEVAFRCGVIDWSSEEYEELRYSDLTEEERQTYITTPNQTMYCHKGGVDLEDAA